VPLAGLLDTDIPVAANMVAVSTETFRPSPRALTMIGVVRL
jgi:hypothetical protein